MQPVCVPMHCLVVATNWKYAWLMRVLVLLYLSQHDQLGINGSLRGMKDFFTQPICDAAKHIAGIWGRNFAAQPSQRLALPQNVNSPAALRYVYDEYQRLAMFCQQVGREITDESDQHRPAPYNSMLDGLTYMGVLNAWRGTPEGIEFMRLLHDEIAGKVAGEKAVYLTSVSG